MVKIDIIIPAYNAEKYIKGCIKSIIKQTYVDWNAICIDDGSTDNTGKILDSIALEDSRVKVFHTQNSGLITARLEGLSHVKSDWITFVDADDIVLPNMLFELMRLIEKYQCDIACCGHRTMSTHGNYVKKGLKGPYKENVYNGVEVVPFFHGGDFISPVLWGKVYRRELFLENNAELEMLPRVFYGEDSMINSLLFEKAENVVVSDAALYCYRYGGGSLNCSETRIAELAVLYSWRKNYLKRFNNDKCNKNNIAQILNATIYYCSRSKDTISREQVCYLLKEVIEDMQEILPNYRMKYAFDLNNHISDNDFMKLYHERKSVIIKRLLLQLL